jgi:tetratricopeptide (TPR) repeat protein
MTTRLSISSFLAAVHVVVAGACGGATSRGPARPIAERRGVIEIGPAGYRPHSPVEFLRIMDRSSQKYQIVTADATAMGEGTPLNQIRASAGELHPQARIVRIRPDTLGMTIDGPSGALVPLFEAAMPLVVAGDFAGAEKVYRRALSQRPDYFLTWTNLGSTLYSLGRYNEAIAALEKAIALHDLGYQAHWYLADARLAKGDRAGALAAITKAFVLNRNGPRLKIAVRNHLRVQGLRLREHRLNAPFRIVRKDARRILVVLPSHADGMACLPLAACLAVWAHEPPFVRLDAQMIERAGFNPLKWTECLHGQAAVSRDARDKGRRLGAFERHVVDVAEAGLLDALITWEIAVAHDATWSIRVKPALRDGMAQYLRRHVYEPIPNTGTPPSAFRP